MNKEKMQASKIIRKHCCGVGLPFPIKPCDLANKIETMENQKIEAICLLSNTNQMLYELYKIWKVKMPKSASDVLEQYHLNENFIDELSNES